MPSPRSEHRLWRVFPWDTAAASGEPFSAEYIPKQGSGRFDLGGKPPVLYLGESPVHASAEKIQRYRGLRLELADLREFGRPLALVEIILRLPEPLTIPDLCDPDELVRYRCRPDELMSRDLVRTQGISRNLYRAGVAGFRVWSALTGDWHPTIVYFDRVSSDDRLEYGDPVKLEMASAALQEAAEALNISLPSV